METTQLYVDGFLLRILDSAYLVEVEPANGKTGRCTTPMNLPEWIFKSAHAIWLSQEEASLFERARKGEEIKNRLMNVRNKGTVRPTSELHLKNRKESGYENQI